MCSTLSNEVLVTGIVSLILLPNTAPLWCTQGCVWMLWVSLLLNAVFFHSFLQHLTETLYAPVHVYHPITIILCMWPLIWWEYSISTFANTCYMCPMNCIIIIVALFCDDVFAILYFVQAIADETYSLLFCLILFSQHAPAPCSCPCSSSTDAKYELQTCIFLAQYIIQC